MQILNQQYQVQLMQKLLQLLLELFMFDYEILSLSLVDSYSV